MEVTPPKQLHRHAIPIVMITTALLALSALAFSSYNADSLNTETALARGLVTRVLHVTPAPNGLAKFTLDPSPTTSNVGSSLPASPADSGRTAQLSLTLQASPTK
jgi:hypothetical protein